MYTQAAHPIDWATTQMNLAVAYKNRIAGDKSANMEVEGQNALVPPQEALVEDPNGGLALSLVPGLGKRSHTPAASASAAKRCK